MHRFWMPFFGVLAAVLFICPADAAMPMRGRDLLPVFARAHAGHPLRVAAIGGSITQAGNGWIGPWLQARFPRAVVTMHNAGMSATGSLMGLFRLERDVISAQPDLVLIEFAVNDGHEVDEDAIRYTESIVVRLKRLPRPPAIIFIEAAVQGGSNPRRHQAIATRYGLLDVDLYPAVEQRLTEAKQDWNALFSDAVHPTDAGHAFYTQAITGRVAPYVELAKTVHSSAPARFPKPLSRKPLLRDGRLVPLDPQNGWRIETALPFWWNKFFNGVISASEPGTRLVLTARGTMIGLFYALDPKFGPFYVSLDGGPARLVDCSLRGGYDYTLLGQDLTPGEHVVTLVVAKPIGKPTGGPVKLGYLMTAGETGSGLNLTPQGQTDPGVLATSDFHPIPASVWEWIGPYGGTEKTIGPTADLQTVFPPETATPVADTHRWQQGAGTDAGLDLGALTGWSDRGVCYARTTLRREAADRAMLALRIDYFGKIWLNGTLIRTIEGHGNVNLPILIPVDLRAGDNTLLVKIHSGSRGNRFALYLAALD